ncbi:MAG: large-conductance mechanosensitive channel protein MscL [Bacteroidetes bacterium]|jgi:large conductance mechanosensitive channel|nr:large-conductance mechanosensitive channel protein MscL [Bacteroidota bacterium]
MGVFQEFKAFAMRGNVMDMAIGVIIGGAFGKIVSSLVNDVIMPPLGVVLGGVNFRDLGLVIKDAVLSATGEVEQAAVSLNYGNFIQATVDFLIIAFAIFMVIKVINKMKKREEEVPAAPTPEPSPSKEELLLTEIRDLLKRQ